MSALETRREELRAARSAVFAIYDPLLTAWKDGLSANEFDRLIIEAGRQAEPHLRRIRRLRRIVADLETHAIEGKPTP